MEQRVWTVLEVLRWTSERFAKQGIESPRLDAEVLLANCLGVGRIRLYVDYAKPLKKQELAAFRALVKRRLAHEPVAYIIGKREFWSLTLQVSDGVLIPRPETELLVELALAMIKRLAASATPVRLVDVGCGSGAIALSLKKEHPDARVFGVDRSPSALRVARKNSADHGLVLSLLQADLLAPFGSAAFELIVANLPYIPRAEVAGLQADVARWEPHQALDGGDDGLDLVRRLVAQVPKCLVAGGGIALEIDPRQASEVQSLLADAGFQSVRAVKDLAGLVRVVTGENYRPIAYT
jgi:release factor glutamine methyltransferase